MLYAILEHESPEAECDVGVSADAGDILSNCCIVKILQCRYNSSASI